jgi:hypothetical protein
MFAKSPASARLQGRIAGGSYASPAGIFTIAVPEMRNPFIKEPSLLADRILPEGGTQPDRNAIRPDQSRQTQPRLPPCTTANTITALTYYI